MSRNLWIALVLLATVACGRKAPPPDADTVAVRALLDRSADVENAGDIAGWVDLFAPDAVYMPDNSPPITTRDDLERVAVSSFSRYRHNVRLEPVEVLLLGDWAFARATVTGSAVPKGDGNPVVIDRNAVLLCRRQADGNWRIARLIENSNRAR